MEERPTTLSFFSRNIMTFSDRQQWRSSKQGQCKPGSIMQPAVPKTVSSRVLNRPECGNITASLADLQQCLAAPI